MNYYSQNYYPQYPNNQFLTQYQQPTYQPVQQTQSINGKMVDSAEMAKVAEVPLGGYGIFPKVDLSEIYIKTWNQNGTTSILTYQPIEQQTNNDINNMILEKINLLENKIDAVLSPKEASGQVAPRKEGSKYEY